MNISIQLRTLLKYLKMDLVGKYTDIKDFPFIEVVAENVII